MQKLLVCTNYRANPTKPSCGARGSKVLLSDLSQLLQQQNVAIIAEEVQCLGVCEMGPNLRLMPNGAFFNHVSVDSFEEIVAACQLFVQAKK